MFYLAGHLHMTVSELGTRMTWREFKRWVWLFEHKPFGEAAQDGRFLDLMTFYGNAHTPKGKRKNKFLYFLPRKVYDRAKKAVSKPKQTAVELGAKLRGFAQQIKAYRIPSPDK